MPCPEEMALVRLEVVELGRGEVAVAVAEVVWAASPWDRAAVVSAQAVDTRWPTPGELRATV